MAIKIDTTSGAEILEKLEFLVSQDIIRTWEIDDDKDYTISSSKWNNKAWFRPHVTNAGALVFGIISSKSHTMTKELYGVYHGRLATTILAHFDDAVSGISISSQIDRRFDIV